MASIRIKAFLATQAFLLLSGCYMKGGLISMMTALAPPETPDVPKLTSSQFVGPGIASSTPLVGTCPQTVMSVSVELGGLKFTIPCLLGKFSGNADLSSLNEGTYRVVTSSTYDEKISSIATLIRDDTKPSSPTTFGTSAFVNSISSSPSVSWFAASDNLSGIDHYEARLLKDSDSSEVTAWATINPGQAIANLSLSEGLFYRLQVRAIDCAGNISDPMDSPTFQPDLTVPSPSFWFPMISQIKAAGPLLSPEFSWNPYFDSLAGVDHYEGSLGTTSGASDLVDWISISANSSPLTMSQQVMVVIPGEVYYFNLRAVDRAGNVSSVRSVDWTIPQTLANQTNFVGHGPLLPSYVDIKTQVSASTTMGNGKHYVGGMIFGAGDASNVKRMLRLNSDGSRDLTFDLGTGFDKSVNRIIIDTSGKILVAGLFSSYQGVSASGIVRLNSNGTRDVGFNIGSGFDSEVNAIALSNDASGRIYVAGSFSHYNGVFVGGLARLNNDGSLDTTFATGTGVKGVVYDLFILPDGRILAAGNFSEFNGVTNLYQLICLNSNGSRDANYITTPSISFGNTAMRIRSAGAHGLYLIGTGIPFSYGGSLYSSSIIRINAATGVVDGTFSSGIWDRIYDLVTDSSDLPIIASGDYRNVQRLTNSGIPDFSFASFGWYGNLPSNTEGRSYDAGVIQVDGKILFGGDLSYLNRGASFYQFGRLVRMTSTGAIDLAFAANIGTGFNATVRALALQSDGRILAGGDFVQFGGIMRGNVVRMNSDFSIDNSFVTPAMTQNSSSPALIYRLAVQSDGKLLVGGNFTVTTPIVSGNLIRLNTNGSIDVGFSIGTHSLSGEILDLAIQADQKIIALGEFDFTHQGIARFNVNGTDDGTYNLGIGFQGRASSIQIQPDGRALIAGSFTKFNAVTVKPILRLSTDGSLDPTFSLATSDSSCDKLRLQTDGKIVVMCNGGLRRLNNDGSLDLSFLSPIFLTGSINFIEPLISGKYLVGTASGVIRLNADGSKDMTFYVPIVSDVKTSIVLSSTSYWLGGFFNFYNQTPVMNSVVVTPP